LKKALADFDKMKLSLSEKMLLDKLIDFNSVWKFDSKELKTNLYKLFFDWKE
jgi:hypothetical protein